VDAVLLIPPATDVRSPHLAVPSLAAALRADGVRTRVRDLNLEGLLSFLDTAPLIEAARTCEACLDRASGDGRTRLRQVLATADRVVTGIADALRVLRDPEDFYDPHRHHVARATVVAALDLVSAASGRVDYNISTARYEIAGVDPSRLADLERVTADPSANLFRDLYHDSVLPELERSRPDLVGISILNGQQILPGLMLARLLKAHGHFVVVGGTVYAKFVDELVRRPEFLSLFCDGLVPYEGETALLALLEQLAGRRDLAAVPNLLYLDRSGSPVMGRSHVEDVNALPTPDFSDLPLGRYLSPAPVLPLLTGKGCYFNRCKFCDIPFINTISPRAYRVRSPELVAGDVAALQARHGVRHFEITDETLSPKLLLRLADALDRHPEVEARFVGYARLERGFTPEACARIRDMGVRKLFFGLESGSQATLDHMCKGIDLGTARTVLRNCADAGIGFHLFSIIGFPEEDEASARETLGFMVDQADVLSPPRNSFDIHPFGLDLRTEYSDQAERYGVVIDDAALAERDFPISVERWENTRGLGPDDVDRLLTEFGGVLRGRFAGVRNYPDALWPGFEEYAVLYSDHYDGRPFPFRLCLPHPGDPVPLRLEWADDVRVEAAAGGRCTVSTLTGAVTVGEAALVVLARGPAPAPVNDLLAEMASGFDHTRSQRGALLGELRAVVDRLLGIRALWLVAEEERERSAEPAGAPAGAGPV
jgi:anaerobic magnesium-protoporphyrin IX monomethyl ester cyclase